MSTTSEPNEHMVVNRARGKMLTPSASSISVRDFPALISDEPPARGGENRGPTPLEHILVALCA